MGTDNETRKEIHRILDGDEHFGEWGRGKLIRRDGQEYSLATLMK